MVAGWDHYKKQRGSKMKKSLSGKAVQKKSRSRKEIRNKIRKSLIGMTLRQVKYRKNRLAGMNIFAAARAAGYSVSYARTTASIKLERQVRASIIEELEMAGATDQAQARELSRIAFRSMTKESCRVYREDGEGGIEVEDAGKEVPDDNARLRALEQIGKLKKQISVPFEKTMFGQDFTRLTIVVEKEPGNDNGPTDNVDAPAKPRVALTDG